MNVILSKNNNKIKDLVKFRDDSKYRDSKSLFYVEGERIVKDTPIELIDSIYLLEDKLNYYKYIIDKIDDNIIYLLNKDAFDKIKDTVNSQGIIALVKYNLINKIDNLNFDNLKTCLILDSINDPGNLGTIIRLSEACNISFIMISHDSCSLYNTKVIRSCMSSIFRTKIYVSYNLYDDINKLKKNGFKIYSSLLDNKSKKFSVINYKEKIAVILGNEANGIKNELISVSDDNIYIPMCGSIESLNVSVAATAICYEIMRQNNYYEA